MLNIVILGIIKIIDNIISTAKSITTYGNKKIATSILTIISQFMFYFIIKSVVTDSSTASTITVCICSGIGTYIAMMINDRFKKDATYWNVLTCDSLDAAESLYDYLLSHKIKSIVFDTYDRENKPTKTIMAFASTKQESSIIDNYLNQSDTKYLRQILH